MEAVVTGMAKSLGIDWESPVVAEAIQTAVLASRDGRPHDLCIELARGVLIRATQPELVFAAA